MMQTIIGPGNDELEENDTLSEREARDWYDIPKKYKLKDDCVMVPYADFSRMNDEVKRCAATDQEIIEISIKIYRNTIDTIGVLGVSLLVVSGVTALCQYLKDISISPIIMVIFPISLIFVLIASIIPTDYQSAYTVIKHFNFKKLKSKLK